MPDTNDYCARCGRLSTCRYHCYYETDFNGYHIPDYDNGYDSSSSDEELSYLEEIIEYLTNMRVSTST